MAAFVQGGRYGFDVETIRAFPVLPEAAKEGKRLIPTPGVDVVRLPVAVHPLPLVEPIGGDQRATATAGGTEGRLVCTVSARVLIMRMPIPGSLNHEGIRPQWRRASSRSPLPGGWHTAASLRQADQQPSG